MEHARRARIEASKRQWAAPDAATTATTVPNDASTATATTAPNDALTTTATTAPKDASTATATTAPKDALTTTPSTSNQVFFRSMGASINDVGKRIV